MSRFEALRIAFVEDTEKDSRSVRSSSCSVAQREISQVSNRRLLQKQMVCVLVFLCGVVPEAAGRARPSRAPRRFAGCHNRHFKSTPRPLLTHAVWNSTGFSRHRSLMNNGFTPNSI